MRELDLPTLLERAATISTVSEIRWRLHLRSSPRRVFAMLDSAQGRASFWAEEAVSHGDSVHFRFADGSRETSRVLRREPDRLFELEYFGSPACFTLEESASGGTDLTLTHRGVPADDWLDTFAGWANVLLPLKASVDFGVDLRNHDPGRSWRDGYLDQ